MAQKTMITYVCDGCGQSASIMEGEGAELPMLEYIITSVPLTPWTTAKDSKGRNAKQTERLQVHFHAKCLPPFMAPLLPAVTKTFNPKAEKKTEKKTNSHEAMLNVVEGSQKRKPRKQTLPRILPAK
jgi:hypothetical protein